ncbi:MAG: hypothetical protein FWJ90_15690 [Actinomadura sp.]
MGIDRPGGTDTRTENVEKPPAEDQPPAPPPDRPGSPGQPSRLESLRAAREAQEAHRAETGTQRTGAQETGTEQQDEREKDATESSPAEPTGEESEAQSGPEDPGETQGKGEGDSGIGTGEREREADHSRSGAEEARQDESGGRPVEGSGESMPETDTGRRGERRHDETDSTSPEPGDAEPDTPASPQADEDEPETGEAARPDGSEEQPGPERPGETVTEAPDARHESRLGEANDEAPRNRDLPSLPQYDDHEPGAESVETENDQSEQDALASTDQQGGTADTQRPAQEPDRDADTPRPPAGPPITVTWPPETDGGAARWSSPVVQFNDRSTGAQVDNRARNGREQEETPTTTDDEANKHRTLPDLPRDGTPGRGDRIPPEDDPADRNPDPEDRRRSRWENFDRVNTAFDATKKVIKGVKDLQAKPPPTGQAESRTGVSTNQSDTQSGPVTDPVSNGIVAATAIVGGILKVYRTYSSRRSEDADNR